MASNGEGPVAVLLNGNAKRVSRDLLGAFDGILAKDDLFYSTNLRDSRTIARTVVDRRYKVILTGGGDGTFATFVSHIYSYMGEAGITDYQPRFGVLKLGTGNALAMTFGAQTVNRANLARELSYAANGASIKTLRLIEVEGRKAPFTGLGLDAMILNDYITVRELMHGTPLQATSKGLLGYWMGIMGYGVPRVLMSKVPEAVIVNEGGDAYQLDGDGRRTGPVIRKGEVIYKGSVRIASASKVPFYGFEFKLFPYAMINDDKFHLRIGKVTALEAFGYLPSVWKGTYSSPRVFDYLADSVAIHMSDPVPFQIAGDGEGWRSYVKLSLSPVALPMIDFKTSTD